MSTRRSWLGNSARAVQASAAILAAGLLAGCTSSEVLIAHSVDLVSATDEVPESALLDVGVTVFNPGVPEGEIDQELLEELIREGTFVQIRRTEALYMAVLLRDTLQQSGHWGGVWVTPEPSLAADLNVSAEILHSDGDYLGLKVTAVDAAGRVWLDGKYEMNTAAGSFNRQRYPELDPYQDVFNRISNDLAAALAKLPEQDRNNVRTIAALRYAAELSPEAFEGYVTADRQGRYTINRLPAVDDPMFDRTQRVRQRERLFFDTLDQHYEKFYAQAMPSYDSWRQYAREEAISIRELTQTARWRTGIGIATIVTSLVYGSNNNNSFSDRVIRDALMYVGMDMLRTSAVRRQEKRLHTEALEELSASFDDNVEPLIVEIQGTQRRLTGTAEAQYQEWRDLLRELFVAETGFVPEDLTIYAEPEPEAAPAIDAASDGVDPAGNAAPPAETQAAPAAEPPAEEGAAEGDSQAVTDAGSAAPSGA